MAATEGGDAHPRLLARRTVVHAFERNPGQVWTRESLANWYSLPLGLVDEVVADLVAARLVRRVPGPDEG
ncbi:MAG TPA: hypothetical protein VGR41_04230 [Actinomycetota bacterium]|nr:hypothetical protein [Actinomycetota bacterium]